MKFATWMIALLACASAAQAQKAATPPPFSPAVPTLGGRPAKVLNPPAVEYGPLLNYDGEWQMKKDNPGPNDKPVTMDNDCVRTGAFVVCEQNVEGQAPSLDVFTYAGEPGRYYASPLDIKGNPLGRGDLTIDGDVWTYSSQETKNGKTTYYRTVNEFSDGNEKIKFRVEESADGRTWKTTMSGVETMIHH